MAFLEAAAALMVLVVPGWTWSLAIFPDRAWWRRVHEDHDDGDSVRPHRLDLLARLALAVALSLTAAPVFVLLFWALGIPFTPVSGWMLWIVASAAPFAWPQVRARLRRTSAWRRLGFLRDAEDDEAPQDGGQEPTREGRDLGSSERQGVTETNGGSAWWSEVEALVGSRGYRAIFTLLSVAFALVLVRIAMRDALALSETEAAVAVVWTLAAGLLLVGRRRRVGDRLRFGLWAKTPPWAPPVVVVALTGVALWLRRLPYRHTDIPLGYDYGFYKAAMDFFARSAPSVPVSSQPAWMAKQFPPGINLLHEALFVLGGMDAYTHLFILFPLLSAFMVVVGYAVAREFVGTVPALVTAALMAVSRSQYLAFELLYGKNVLGLIMFLGLVFLLHRRRWLSAGLVLSVLVLVHRPMFLLGVLTVAATGAVSVVRHRRWQGYAQIALVGAVLVLPVMLWMPDTFLRVAQRAWEDIVGGLGGEATGSGTFLTRGEYHALAPYFWLALAAAFLPLRRGAWMVRAVLFVCLAIVYGELVLFRRYILMLDVVVVLLAGLGLLAAVRLAKAPKQVWIASLAVLLVVGVSAAPTVRQAVQEPTLPIAVTTPAQYDDILWMRDNLPENATILTDIIAAPLVYADSGRTTYGPGMFGDPHSPAQWNSFRRASMSPEERRAFLDVYGGPVYIALFADNIVELSRYGPTMRPEHFDGPEYTLVLETDATVVVRYAGST